MKRNHHFLTFFLVASVVLTSFGNEGAKTATVNQIAARPADYLGTVRITGVVATVNPNKGFLLVDQHEYSECGLTCLKEAGTKKIPVQWQGEAPKVEQLVQVEGKLTRSDKGLSFSAEKVENR